MKFLIVVSFILLATSCSTEQGEYRCKKFVSSKQQAFYVKSYNWGITGDSQLSTISGNDDQIGFEDKNKPHIIEGLEPFIYRLEHDTLTIYSRVTLNPFVINCPSLTVQYRTVDNPQYMSLHLLTRHKPYYAVPEAQPGDYNYKPKL